MKKLVYILILLAGALSNVEAQSRSEITVVSDDFGDTLTYAHVYFTCLDCKIEQMEVFVLTNDKGRAKNHFDVKTALRIIYIGYENLLDTLEGGASKTYFLKPDRTEIGPVIITAQYQPTTAEESVHKVKIIDREKMDAQGAVTLKDVLSNETNIRVAQDNILGSSTSIQGLSGQNVKILIDGVPVVGRLNGNVDLSQINLNNIEQIEIVEGPLSVEYGTNALGGTINLISKKNQKDSYNLGLNSYYETLGQYNIDGQLGWNKKKNSFTISGGRNYFDGWSPRDDFIQFPKSGYANANRVNQWNPKEQVFGQFQYSRAVKKLKLGFSSNWFKETIINKGTPRQPYNETAFDDYYRTWRLDHAMTVAGKVGKTGNLNLIFALNNYKRTKNTYYKDLTTLDESLTPNPSDQDTTYYQLVLARGTYSTSKDSSKVNYSLGYDLNVETGKGKRLLNSKQQIGDYAGFASLEYMPFQKLIIRPGLRYSYNTSYDSPLTPSINVRYKSKKYTFRASYSKGFRAPSIKDLYFNFVDVNHDIQGNPNLTAETSDHYNLSLDWVKTKRHRKCKLTSSFFYNDIKNLITLAQREGSTSYSYFNLDRYKTIGVQLGTELRVEHFKLALSGTYTGRYNSLSKEADVEPYTYSPELRSNASYEFKKRKITVSLFYKYTGQLTGYYLDEESEVQENFLGAFNTLDFTSSKAFFKNRIKWTIGVKNIFDVQDIQSSGGGNVSHSTSTGSVPMSWGRSVFTSLRINLDNQLFHKKTK